MKTIWIIIVLAVVVGVAAIVTKPSDDQCVQLAKNELNKEVSKATDNSFIKAAASLFVDFGVDKVFFRIEDKVLYKEVYIKGSDTKLGTVAFGSFFMSDKLKESVK